MAKTIALFFLSLFCLNHAHATPRTIKHELPLPFTFYENFYYFEKHSTFFEVGSTSGPPSIGTFPDRHFSLKSIAGLHKNTEIDLIKNTTLLLFTMPIMKGDVTHFFHLLEHLVGIWSFYGNDHSQDVELIILAGDGHLNSTLGWEGPNDMNKHLLTALFPNARVQRWDQFVLEHPEKVVRMEKALISDRAITFYDRECDHLNKMLGAALPFLSSTALQGMAEKMHSYAKVHKRAKDTLEIVYTKRNPPRTLDASIEEQLLEEISALEGVTLRVIDFAKIPFLEQIDVIANTDILLGVHGNGLSHLLFLPQESAVIEIHSSDSQMLDYRLFADARKLDYLGIISNQGPIDNKTAYEKGFFGNPNTTIYSLDTLPILDFIKTQLMHKLR